MPSLNLDVDYFDHPKTKRLIGLLGRGAEVLPLRVWCFVGKYHPESGRLTGYSAQEIESLAGWWGKPGAGVAGLVKVGFLKKDGDEYVIHEWHEHEGHLHAFKVRGRKAAAARWAKIAGDASGIPDGMLEAYPKQCPLPTNPPIPSLKRKPGSFADRVMES